jgi:cell division septum initiation protein DivIVA
MKILGLLDTLESLILDGFKIPLTKKTIVNEEQILSIIDKIRLVVQGGEDFGKHSAMESEVQVTKAEETKESVKATDVLQQAYQLAKEIREGADKYADEMLSNLELTTTRILRTVRAGRERLDKTARGKVESAER